jgi:tetratricopeptide (TPR) repeat protein
MPRSTYAPRGAKRPSATRWQAAPTPGFTGFLDRNPHLLILAGTLLLAIVTYARSLGNGFIDFDDPENIVDNYSIRELNLTNIGHFFTSPLEFMYTPLASISYAIDYQLGGLHPAMYHTTNLLLHLANVVLVFLVVRRLTDRPFVAHVAAVLFAIHPMNVDSVAWLATRSNLLATLFALATMLAYLRYTRRPKLTGLALVVVLFAGAALSKSTAVVLPAVLVLIDLYQGRSYLRDRRPVWRPILDKLPLVAISVAIGLVALSFRADTITPPGYTALDRVVIVCTALVTYLGKLVAPVHLALAYAYPVKPLAWYLYLAPLVLVAVAAALLMVKSARRIVAFGLGFFVITILLSQAVWLIDNYTANRYAYLPYVGLFVVVGHFAERLTQRVREWRFGQAQPVVAGVLVIVTLAFSVVAGVRVSAWHDTTAVMSDSIAKEPRVAFVYSSRGVAEYNAEQFDAAEKDFTTSAGIDPNYVLNYFYLGRLKHRIGDYSGAVAQLNEALSRAPDWAVALNERGKSFGALNDSASAIADFTRAIELDAYLVDAYHQRGIIEIANADYAGALRDFDRVIELLPGYADAWYYRGIAKASQQDLDGACKDWVQSQTLGQTKATSALNQTCANR